MIQRACANWLLKSLSSGEKILPAYRRVFVAFLAKMWQDRSSTEFSPQFRLCVLVIIGVCIQLKPNQINTQNNLSSTFEGFIQPNWDSRIFWPLINQA